MNKLTNEQLMQIIVNLDTSHKKEKENFRLENRCLRNIMRENETEHTMNMIDHCTCHACDTDIANYTHYLSEEMGGGKEYIETVEKIHKCKVCKHQFCHECVTGFEGGTPICIDCYEIRKQTRQIRRLVLLIE